MKLQTYIGNCIVVGALFAGFSGLVAPPIVQAAEKNADKKSCQIRLGGVMEEVRRTGRLEVAAVQFPITANQTRAQLLSSFENFVRTAKRQGAQLVMFPELFTLDMMTMPSQESEGDQVRRIAREIASPLFEKAQQLSRELDIAILSGSTPRVKPDGSVMNSAFIAFPDGRTLIQDKLFLTPDERDWGLTAGTEVQVFDAPWGRTAILICYDCEIPRISDVLAETKPELILVPSMTGAVHGFYRVRWTAQARAIEHYSYVVHVGTVGGGRSIQGFNNYGQASVITPRDVGFPGLLTEGPLNESAVVRATLDFGFLREKRAQAGIYPARDQVARELPVDAREVDAREPKAPEVDKRSGR